jgi:hypothetical protein
MIDNGRSWPNVTEPAETTGAAETGWFKATSFADRPCRPAAAGSIRFYGFEYEGCAGAMPENLAELMMQLGNTRRLSCRLKPAGSAPPPPG